MARAVILVDVRWRREKDPEVSLGHASLATSLRRNPAVEVRSLAFSVNCKAPDLDGMTNDVLSAVHRPSCETDIAIGVYVWGERIVKELLSRLRRCGFQGRIILGGPQITFSGPGLELLYPEADIFIRGYAESALASVVAAQARTSVVGVHYAGEHDRLECSSPNITRMPSPWLAGAIGSSNRNFIWWETKRGCPFRCSFCQHFGAGPQLTARQIPIARLEKEVALFRELGVSDMKIIDPVFNMPRTHHLDVLRMLAGLRTLQRLVMEARFEFVTEEFASLVARLGGELEFGIQTAVPAEEAAICRRNDRQKISAAVQILHDHGIRFTVSLIYGLPRQTPASFLTTIEYVRSLSPAGINAFPLGLYRGSRLERERERWGFEVPNGPLPLVVASDSFTRADYRRMEAIAAEVSAQ